MGKIYISMPFSTPLFLGPFLSTMDFKAIIVWCIMLAVDVLIYIPFVKMYDGSLLKAEKQRSEQISEGNA